jgi:hypothetical protein
MLSSSQFYAKIKLILWTSLFNFSFISYFEEKYVVTINKITKKWRLCENNFYQL